MFFLNGKVHHCYISRYHGKVHCCGSLVLLPLTDHFGRESGVGLNLNDSIKLSVVDEHLFSVNPARDYKKFEMVKKVEKNNLFF